MSEKPSREEFEAATRRWVEAAEAVRRWREEHVALWWAESDEPPPAEPKVVTKDALAEGQRLRQEEEEAHEEWERINRAYLDP